MPGINVEGRIDELPLEPQRVIRELAEQVNIAAGYLFVGAGDPSGNIVANRGAVYLRTDGGAGSTLWIKEADDGLATGWTAV